MDTRQNLLAEFLDEAGKRMPEIAWRKVSDYVLAYPDSSPVFGTLTVSFDWEEITLYFGRHHQHFTLIEGDIKKEAREIAVRTLTFVRELVNDRVVVRWGAYGSRTFRMPQSLGLMSRLWRIVTPWVREAVWSERGSA